MNARIDALLAALPGLRVEVKPSGNHVIIQESGQPLYAYATTAGLHCALTHMVETKRDDLEARCRAILPAYEAAEPADPVCDDFAALCKAWAACKRALESEVGQ